MRSFANLLRHSITQLRRVSRWMAKLTLGSMAKLTLAKLTLGSGWVFGFASAKLGV